MFRNLSAFIVAAALLGAPAAAQACPESDCNCDCEKGKQAQKAEAAEVKIGYVEADELEKWMAAGQVTVIDANGADVYAKNHIPGAIHLTKDQVTAEALPADKATRLAFYCYSEKCGASHKAAKKAIELGYTNVFVYKGGIEGWIKAGKKVATGAPAAPKKVDG